MKVQVERDQVASGFHPLLERLRHGADAVAAALVDGEGETVDYAGRLPPYDIRVAAAECRLILALLKSSRGPLWRTTEQLVIRARKATFVVVDLAEGYALVLQLPRGAFMPSSRAISEASRCVCAEAGLEPARVPGQDAWVRVQVQEEPNGSRRPRALWYLERWCLLLIIGRYAGSDLGRREHGYRVRIDSGLETTLVRERWGRWYSEYPMGGV